MEDFKKWLLERPIDYSEIDLLQGLASIDNDFPHYADWREYKNYLAGKNAPYSFIEAFERAWEQFINERLGVWYEQERIRECDTPRTKAS